MTLSRGEPRPVRSLVAAAVPRVITAAVVWIVLPASLAQEEAAKEKPTPAKGDAALDELGQKLMRKVIDDSPEDVMAAMIRLMGESARRLEVDFDAGEETQAVQRRVLEELDSAIKEAASRRRRSAPQDQSSASADKRRKPADTQAGGRGKKEGEGNKGAGPAEGSSESATQLTEAAKSGGELKESRRAWGHLPPRERDEVIQGAEENSLERYRQWIERYYRALQESAE